MSFIIALTITAVLGVAAGSGIHWGWTKFYNNSWDGTFHLILDDGERLPVRRLEDGGVMLPESRYLVGFLLENVPSGKLPVLVLGHNGFFGKPYLVFTTGDGMGAGQVKFMLPKPARDTHMFFQILTDRPVKNQVLLKREHTHADSFHCYELVVRA